MGDDHTVKNSSVMPKKEETSKSIPKVNPKKKGPVVSSLNQYAMYDKNHPLNRPFPSVQDFKGPKRIIVLKRREKDY